MKHLMIAALLLAGLAINAQQTINLNTWKFKSGGTLEWAEPLYNDSDWNTVTTGKSWETQGYPGYNGYAWYRVRFNLPSGIKNSTAYKDSVLLCLGFINNSDQVFLNGKLLGQNARIVNPGDSPISEDVFRREPGFNLSRNYAVSVKDTRLLWDRENVLAVRVHNTRDGGGMYTQPVNIRMKDVADYLWFDITSGNFASQSNGHIAKTIMLKNLSPAIAIKGNFAIQIFNADNNRLIAQKNYPVNITTESKSLSIDFKGRFSQRMKASYIFTETQSHKTAQRAQALPFSGTITKAKEVSGKYYDWTKTMQPEQPWKHDYNKTLVMKIGLGTFKGINRLDQVLEVLRKLDNLTLGIPKIVYLVGWQRNGFSWPSWNEDPALKREIDSTAVQSLRWFFRAAKAYNTTISLHVDMIDACEDSPLWDEYVAKDIVAKDLHGNIIKGELWGYAEGGVIQSYQISYAQEWKLGFTQKRIDNLIKMIPELKESGTIHIDFFISFKIVNPNEPISPYLGISTDEEIATQRKIFRYWQKQGIDVTSEGYYFFRKDIFAGLQAMPWWYEEADIIDKPWFNKPADFKTLPVQFSAYTPMHAEDEINNDPEKLPGLLEQFCLKVVPWYYKKNPDVAKEGSVNITDDEVICPVLWKDKALVAYSKEVDMMKKKIRIPSTWVNVKEVQLFDLTIEGLRPGSILQVSDGIISLSINKNQPTVIMPVGAR